LSLAAAHGRAVVFAPRGARENGKMNGSKKRVENESPPEGPYIIRTGFHFDDERTGRRFETLMCSDDQNGAAWLEEQATVKSHRSLTCRSDRSDHGKAHEVISFREAVEWGVLDAAEGCVNVAIDELLRTLARRIA
jgi:hypothetical protein